MNFYFLITNTEQSSPYDNYIKVKNSCSDIFCHEFDGDLPLTLRNRYFIGKDGTKWARRLLLNQIVRSPKVNTIMEKPDVMGDAKNIRCM